MEDDFDFFSRADENDIFDLEVSFFGSLLCGVLMNPFIK
jgi:hypothetical protein